MLIGEFEQAGLTVLPAGSRLSCMTFPTGEQYEFADEDRERRRCRATITGLAAAIRHLSIDGIDLVETYGEESSPPYGAGIVLVPWPNRIRDGRWEHEGVERQLDDHRAHAEQRHPRPAALHRVPRGRPQRRTP